MRNHPQSDFDIRVDLKGRIISQLNVQRTEYVYQKVSEWNAN